MRIPPEGIQHVMRVMCRAKIHRATVTQVDLDYEGSISIDEALLEAANMLPYEQAQVVNINTGARFETYAISAPRGSGTVALNGAAARLALVGDLVIVMAYALCTDEEALGVRPRVVRVDGANRIFAEAHA